MYILFLNVFKFLLVVKTVNTAFVTNGKYSTLNRFRSVVVMWMTLHVIFRLSNPPLSYVRVGRLSSIMFFFPQGGLWWTDYNSRTEWTGDFCSQIELDDMFCWGNTVNGELGFGGIEEERVLSPRELNFSKATNIKESEFRGLY